MPKKREAAAPDWENEKPAVKEYLSREREANRRYTNWTGSPHRERDIHEAISYDARAARKELLKCERLGRAVEKRLEGGGKYSQENVEKAARALEEMKAFAAGLIKTADSKIARGHYQMPQETKEVLVERIKEAANAIMHAYTRGADISYAPHEMKRAYEGLMKYANEASDPDFKYNERGWRVLGGNPKGTERRIGRGRILDGKGLEGKSVAAAIIGLLGALFFFSSTITGNAIGGETASNSMGVVFLIVGLVGSFFWLKGRKNFS